MKIKLGAEALSVNDKTVPIMPTVLDIVAAYNAELLEASKRYTKARTEIDDALKQAIDVINTRYEEKLLGMFDK